MRTPVDGKPLARLVAEGVFAGDPSTSRFLVALGDDQAEQMIENGRRAFRLLMEEAERQLEERRPRVHRTVTLDVADETAIAARLATITGTEPMASTWSNDPEERLYQRFAEQTGVRQPISIEEE